MVSGVCVWVLDCLVNNVMRLVFLVAWVVILVFLVNNVMFLIVYSVESNPPSPATATPPIHTKL